MAASAVGVEVRARSVQGDADQLNETARQYPAGPGVQRHPCACCSPARVPTFQSFEGLIPRSGSAWFGKRLRHCVVLFVLARLWEETLSQASLSKKLAIGARRMSP